MQFKNERPVVDIEIVKMLKVYLCFFVCACFVNSIFARKSLCLFGKPKYHPLTGKTTPEFMKHYCYQFETHKVTSDDGHIITMFRIPHGKNESADKFEKNKTKPAVIIMHGMTLTSADFVSRGPNGSLGLILADQGFDVWLPNSRGTKYSREHLMLSPNMTLKNFYGRQDYWDFSWHELGVLELPSIIDYVLNKTNQKQVYYIGHSQGCSSFFVLCSERPEYNDKIKLAVHMAPSIFSHNGTAITLSTFGPIYKQFIFSDWFSQVMDFVGHFDTTINYKWLEKITGRFCQIDCVWNRLCLEILALTVSLNRAEVHREWLPVFLSNVPNGMSTKELLHYSQIYITGKFRQYDYGPKFNYLRYGYDEPPEYDLTKITAPTALYYMKEDVYIPVSGIRILERSMPNIVESHMIYADLFSHNDFLWADDAPALVYKPILRKMKECEHYGHCKKH